MPASLGSSPDDLTDHAASAVAAISFSKPTFLIASSAILLILSVANHGSDRNMAGHAQLDPITQGKVAWNVGRKVRAKRSRRSRCDCGRSGVLPDEGGESVDLPGGGTGGAVGPPGEV